MSSKLLLFAALAALACSSSDPEHVSAAQRGQQLFEDGTSSVPGSACSHCHPGAEPDPARLYPGSDLGGVTLRSSFWGGQENDLLRAVNACRTLFQGLPPLETSSRAAADLYAYLESLAGSPEPVAFTVVAGIVDLPAGDAELGLGTYAGACSPCHGLLADGSGRLSEAVPVLPDEALAKHADYSAEEQRLVFVEKVRHGRFFGYGGYMPPFSLQVLADEELANLLSALELYP